LDKQRRDTATTLLSDLTQREFGYTIQGDKINLESKRDMKNRGLRSPDIADALVLTYAQEVARSSTPHGGQKQLNMSVHDYDPLDHVSVA
jgi:hypothetical protein